MSVITSMSRWMPSGSTGRLENREPDHALMTASLAAHRAARCRAADGALATSGRDRRTWRRGGRELHHLIDPGTGEPAESDLLRATVVAGDAVEAEIWAKALFLAGSDDAALEADERRLPCLLVTAGGETRLAGGLQ